MVANNLEACAYEDAFKRRNEGLGHGRCLAARSNESPTKERENRKPGKYAAIVHKRETILPAWSVKDPG